MKVTISNLLTCIEGLLIVFLLIKIHQVNKNSLKERLQYNIVKFYIYLEAILFIIITTTAYFSVNNLVYSHLYFIGQFILLSLFYYSLFNLKQKRFILINFALIVPLIIWSYFKNPLLINQFNITEIFFTSAPLVVYSIIHLFNSLSQHSKFSYFNVGILMYISCSTLIFILGNLISNISQYLSIDIWLLNKVLYIGYLTLISLELIHGEYRRKTHN